MKKKGKELLKVSENKENKKWVLKNKSCQRTQIQKTISQLFSKKASNSLMIEDATNNDNSTIISGMMMLVDAGNDDVN